eukprot:879373-Prymnesium_polylepis.2
MQPRPATALTMLAATSACTTFAWKTASLCGCGRPPHRPKTPSTKQAADVTVASRTIGSDVNAAKSNWRRVRPTGGGGRWWWWWWWCAPSACLLYTSPSPRDAHES